MMDPRTSDVSLATLLHPIALVAADDPNSVVLRKRAHSLS